MRLSKAKSALISILLATPVAAYFGAPSGDRWFAVGLWLVFAIIAGAIVLLIPMLRCPDCGRETNYFHNYSETLANRHRRFTKCRGCHAMIDRATGDIVARIPPEEGQAIDRSSILIQCGILFVIMGINLLIVSVAILVITCLVVAEGRSNSNRTAIVVIGSGVGILLGILLIAAPILALRRSQRRGRDQQNHVPIRFRIRW